jgi:hypothetical protein
MSVFDKLGVSSRAELAARGAFDAAQRRLREGM